MVYIFFEIARVWGQLIFVSRHCLTVQTVPCYGRVCPVNKKRHLQKNVAGGVFYCRADRIPSLLFADMRW